MEGERASGDAAQRTGGAALARNSALNLLGWGLPMVAAVASVPLVIRGLGDERFGVLAVGWALIGYFGLFDLGFGRALTKMLAEKLGAGDRRAIPPLVWTGLLLSFLLGVAGAAVLAVSAPWMVLDALRISPGLQAESLAAFRLLAVALPWVISVAALQGVLEANQSFGVLAALRIPTGLFSYLAPLLVLPFSESLVPVVGVLVAGRIVGWVAYMVACLRVLPELRGPVAVRWAYAGDFARFGGWMTVSNVVSPLMTYLDRFLIGALISATAIAYYVTPYDVITRLSMVPSALMGVFFPAFASTFGTDRARTAALFDRALRALFVMLFPVVLVVVALAGEALTLWVGEAFAAQSTGVLRWLAVGVLVNSLGHVPLALLHGAGRPDFTGKLHLVELPLYAAAIWLLSRAYGIEGVAIAWVLRVTADTTILMFAARGLLPGAPAFANVARLAAAAAPVLAAAAFQDELAVRAGILAVGLAAFAAFAWRGILQPAERAFLLGRLAPSRRAGPAAPVESA